MTRQPEYSIVILTHNKSEYSRKCVESILASVDAGLEVVVVDNGSTDDTPELLAEMKVEYEKKGWALKAIRNDHNVGCCTGRNQGIDAAEGRHLVFLDNDIMVKDADWLPKMKSVLDQDAAIRMVGPKIIYPFEPHWIQCAGVAISPNGRVQFRGRGCDCTDPRFAEQVDVQCLISATVMMDKALIDEIGGFDEAFNPIEFEDFDLCYRAREKGYRVVYTPHVEVYHWESITSQGTSALPNTYLIIKNGREFKKRWRHMFEQENGPPDAECKWQKIEMPSLDGRRVR